MSFDDESLDVLDSKDTFDQEYLEEKEQREQREQRKERICTMVSFFDYLRYPIDKNGDTIRSFVFTDWGEYVDAFILANCGDCYRRIDISVSCERSEYKFNCVYDFIVSSLEYIKTINDRVLTDEDRNFARREIKNMFEYEKNYEKYDEHLKESRTFSMFLHLVLHDFIRITLFPDNRYEVKELNNPVKLIRIMRLVPMLDIPKLYQILADTVSPYYILFFYDVSEIMGDMRYWDDHYDILWHSEMPLEEKERYLKYNKSMKEIEEYVSLKNIERVIKQCAMSESFYRDYIFRLTEKLEEVEREFEEALCPGGSIFLKCKERFEKSNK